MISTMERIGLTAHQWLYEKTDGRIGASVGGRPMLLLRHVGRKSGQARTSALLYVRDGDDYAVIASKGGDPKHPLWYHNVKANPEVTVQDGDKVATMTAREIEGAEREHWWKLAVEAYPPYAEYQTKTDRLIPVFIVE